MPLDAKLKKRLIGALRSVDDKSAAAAAALAGPRLAEDAQRLWQRVQKFVSLDLVADVDLDALELACYALQLPMRQSKPSSVGKLARTNLRDRAEDSAELLVSIAESDADESLLDRATRLLHEMPHRPPVLEDARLLADALNLEDFGVVGIVAQIVQLARQGEGIIQLAEGCEKREQYGYWEARLKDGFHFEPVRQIAKRRLQHARQIATMLAEELKEDQP